MSNIWSSPFDLFSNPSSRLREFDLKSRAYQAFGRFWGKTFRLVQAKKTKTEVQSEAGTLVQDLYSDLKKVLEKFKQGEDYTELNPLERLGDRFAREAHKMVFGNIPGGDASLKDIQAALETLWDDFFEVKAGDQGSLATAMNVFAAEVWVALGLSAGATPKFAGGKDSGTGTTEMKLVGKGSVAYFPVVLPKKVIRGMFPSHFLNLETTPLDIQKDEHVVMYVFAKQTVDFGGTKVTYQEVFPSIPYVSVPGIKGQLFQAIPVIWVNNVGIAKGARDYWKINKLYADFKESMNFPVDAAHGLTTASNQLHSSVENADGSFTEKKLLSVEVHAHGSRTYKPSEVDRFADMKKLLDLSSVYWQGEDFYMCTYKIDFSTAKLSYVSGKVETGHLYGMDGGNHILQSLEDQEIGGFKLEYDWVFGAPSSYPPMG